MAGIKQELSVSQVSAQLNEAAQRTGDLSPMWAQVNEYLLRSTRQRFKDQKDPDGTPWQPLSARYRKRKHRNADRILTLRGYLQGTLYGQWTEDALEFGSNRVYAAILQRGGTINMPARSQKATFKNNRFARQGLRRGVTRKNITIGAYTIHMPARRYLGLSAEDDVQITRIGQRFVAGFFTRTETP